MSKSTKFAISAAIIAAAAFGGFLYASPYIAAYNMEKAAEANDGKKLSTYIDFPALKESLKSNLNAAIVSQAADNHKDNPMGALGAVFASALINPMVDALVTPENLVTMMKGEKPDLQSSSKEKPNPTESTPDADMEMKYESFDEFSIAVKSKKGDDDPVVFILSRNNLFFWKLSGLRLSLPKKSPSTVSAAIEKAPEILPSTEVAQEPPIDLAKYVGKHHSEVFSEPLINKKFISLLGEDYPTFTEAVNVASELEVKGNYYFGAGCAAHSCGTTESAFAINIKTGEIFASRLIEGKNIKSYGVTSEQDLPVPLYIWYKEKGGTN